MTPLISASELPHPFKDWSKVLQSSGGSIALALILAPYAQAQTPNFGKSSAPLSGGTGLSSQPTNPFLPMSGTYAANHRTPDGKLCISVHPSATPQLTNPKIVNQIVIVENICGQTIRVQVCYAGSSDCITVTLAGYQKLQRLLGIASSSSFRYEFRELY